MDQTIHEGTDAVARARLHAEIARHRTTFPDVLHISAQQLKDMQTTHPDTLVVDVRSPEERAVSIIPGAIALHELPQQLPP